MPAGATPTVGHRRARRALSFAAGVVGLAAMPTAAGHAGTTHAGTPHWLLLAALVLGLVAVGAGVLALRREGPDRRIGAAGLFAGLLLAGVGAVGLVEIQLEATADPGGALLALHPAASLAIGAAVVLGSQVVTLRYWPERPRYLVLGALLGAWILYPVLMPRGGIAHPFGYALVLGLPVAVGHVLRQDAGDALRGVWANRRARYAGLVAGVVMWIFIAISSGTLTFVPETEGTPAGPFLVGIGVADPLVVWPALELYLPSIPLFAMVSVGTIVLFGTLSVLMAVNVGIVVRELGRTEGTMSPGFLAGTLTTTGATACGCCAPALYGVLSATLGASATPIYWSFMDTSSPLSATFLAASVLLLLASAIRAGEGATAPE